MFNDMIGSIEFDVNTLDDESTIHEQERPQAETPYQYNSDS